MSVNKVKPENRKAEAKLQLSVGQKQPIYKKKSPLDDYDGVTNLAENTVRATRNPPS